MNWGLTHQEVKFSPVSYFGFYKEQGGYVSCLGLGTRGGTRFEYAGPRDAIKLLTVERSMTFPGGSMDLMSWEQTRTGYVDWALADYLGFAIRKGPNLYILRL